MTILNRLEVTMLKTVTYNKIWFGDLENLMREHCGVVFRGDDGNYDNYDFDWPEDCYPFGQYTHIIIIPKGLENGAEEGDKLGEAVKQLFDKGILPTDHPLFIDIWW